MIDSTLDKVSAAIRRRDEMVDTLRPVILQFLGEFFGGMIQRGIQRLSVQVADEDGVRRYFFSATPLEKFDSLYRVKVSKNKTLAPPILIAEIFAGSSEGLRGMTKPLESDDVAEIYTFIADLKKEEAHDQMEVTADSIAVLLRRRSH